ncbi:hypothetical protein NLJ89_g10418 [Agrocybe chaxingu]|uniref:Uncharacterized protein n=1 Tax=Agrocybe chaxingu TaxID=84603 RepID=A0A9W8JYR1_9AGAR|nr:hypothetical protein NLJ89_g10418 [Agrocybe chaxingu]
MKFSSIFTTALAAAVSLLSVTSVSAAPINGGAEPELLEKRAPSLVSHISGSTTFWRAVTRRELAHIGNYPKRKSPKDYLHGPGDFAHDGALYVFHDLNEAKQWGDSFSGVALDPKQQFYYLVKFRYTPNKNLRTKSFLNGTPEWKAFVDASYRGKGAHYDIVEGPVSVGQGPRMQPALSNGNMIYQAAFVGKAALGTLTVEEVTQHKSSKKKDRWCPSCVVM